MNLREKKRTKHGYIQKGGNMPQSARQCRSGKKVIYTKYFAQKCIVLLSGSGGVVNSLDIARHRLSPLAAFTSGAYFIHNGWG